MTYHDKALFQTKAQALHEGRRRYVRRLLRGINDLSLYPAPVDLKFGSLADDLRAVGDDMRKAMAAVKGE